MLEDEFNNLSDSEKVKKTIDKLGRITYKELALKLGCGERSVARWVSGDSNISKKYIGKIKKVLTGKIDGMDHLLYMSESPLDSCSGELDFLRDLGTFPALYIMVTTIAMKLCKHLSTSTGATLKLSSYFMYSPVVVRIDVQSGEMIKAVLSVSHNPVTKQTAIDVYDFNSGALLSSMKATDKGIVRTVSVIKKILHRK